MQSHALEDRQQQLARRDESDPEQQQDCSPQHVGPLLLIDRHSGAMPALPREGLLLQELGRRLLFDFNILEGHLQLREGPKAKRPPRRGALQLGSVPLHPIELPQRQVLDPEGH